MSTPTKSRYDVALDCVHCGLCLEVCPTYLELGNEADSPRGRIYLMRAHDEGRQDLTPALHEHLDLCLVCRACETACPSGVRFGSMIEEFRALTRPMAEGAPKGVRQRLFAAAGRHVLKNVLPNPAPLRRLASLLRFYQRSGAATLARTTGLLRILGVQHQESLAPVIPSGPQRKAWPEVLPAYGTRRARVLFLRGCVTPELLPAMQHASIEALRHNGCDVLTPRTQTCCGALHFHTGYRDEGLALLCENLQAFDFDAVDALVVNAAGCGSTLKEYGHLAAEHPEFAEPAAAFAARVRDISEFLVELGLSKPTMEVRARVAYDEPCHLLHGQGVSQPPKQILDAIPGLERLPLADADRCCGSAGIYNLAHADLANDILAHKIEAIAQSGADTVATGNPGCILQIKNGLRDASRSQPKLQQVAVVHPMQLLARAYRSPA